MSTRVISISMTNALKPGELIAGQYKVKRVLGQGGFATVYLAEQVTLGRDVAIKVLNPLVPGEDQEVARQRFLMEAQAAARISHPNVVTVHDVGILDDQRPYFVMEPYKGHDLGYELRHNRGMDPIRALPLFVDCLGGLAKAHRLGIIHRDIKPNNVVLTDPETRDEALKLIDFGIARTSGSSGLTGSANLIGTMRYFAPEYVSHNIVQPTIDVYQMGVLLVELLTARRVIRGENDAQSLLLITTGRLEIPASLLDSPLGPVIKRATALDHTARYPTAYEFRDALDRIDPRMVPSFAANQPTDVLDSYDSFPTVRSALLVEEGEGTEVEITPYQAPAASAPWPKVSTGTAPVEGRNAPPLPKRATFLYDREPPAATPEAGPTTERKRKKGLFFILGGLVALFLLMVIGSAALTVAFFTPESEGQTAESVTEAETETETGEGETKEAVVDGDAVKESPPAAKTEAETPAVEKEETPERIRVTLTPKSALLFEEKNELGAGEVNLLRPTETRTLLAKAPGYFDHEILLEPNSPETLHVQLEKLPKPKPKPKPKPTRPKPPPKKDDGFGIMD